MMGVGGIGAGVHARGRGRVGVGQGLGEDSPCGLGARWSLAVFALKLPHVLVVTLVLSQIGNFLGTIKHAL